MRWVLVAAMVVACTKPNPNRCCVDDADCRAKDIPLGSLCDPGLLCRGNQCIAEPCASNAECDSAAPFCIDEACAELCTNDAQCPGFNQDNLPRCVQGTCVQCRDNLDCASASPVCEAGACRGCGTHAECESELCDADTGACISEGTIAYASATGSPTADCTRQNPCSLARAFEVVDGARPNIKVEAGAYSTSVITYRNVNVALFGEPGAALVELSLSGGAVYRARDLAVEQFTCDSQTGTTPVAQLDVARLRVTHYINLIRCRATINNTEIDGQPDYCAISLSGSPGLESSELTMARSEIRGGQCGVSLADTSKMFVSNSIFRDQGNLGAIAVLESTVLQSSVSFSTFYNTFWNCTDGTVIFASSNNLFLNESVGAPANTVTGTRCLHNYEIIKPQANAPSGANNILGADPKFVSAASGNFYLMPNSPAIDAADPAATESIDFFGTARPQGAQRDIGAFEYKP